MSESSELTTLEHAHTPEAIRLRMERPPDRSYLSDGVLGGIDGCVTTFAVVAGAVGGALPARVRVSALATAAGFFGIGMLKGRVLRRSMTAAGLETLLIGSAAAALAYGVGYLVRQLYSP